ncbi:MAG: hypothetical protein RL196_1427 [Actinomycetota bacterium]|jgi:uncharacterized membrane protein YbhN (UPF0104 family)
MAKKLIPAVFYALVIIFAAVYLSRIDWQGLSQVTINPWWLAVATAVSLLTRYWFAEIWLLLLTRLGARLEGFRAQLFVVYSKAWLGRYIPGGAAWIFGKIYFASQVGVSKTKLAISSFLEGALQIIVVLVSAAALLAVDPRVSQFGPLWVWGLVAVCVVGLLAVYPPIFNRVVKFGYAKTRKKTLDDADLPNNRTIGLGIAAFAGSALISGLSYFFIAKTLVPTLSFNDVFYVVGTANLASALSMLAFFAPAGLGVRETIQLTTLLVIMNPAQALAVTVFMRLWSIVLDVVFWVGSLAVQRALKAKTVALEPTDGAPEANPEVKD